MSPLLQSDEKRRGGSVAFRLFVAHLTIAASSLPAADPAAAADPQISAVRVSAMPTSPTDAMWRDVPATTVKLIPQDMVEPRQLETTTPEVSVRACTDGSEVAFLLRWDDATVDDVTKPAQFSDACAVQIPANASADVPAPQMGEPGRPVEVAYWRASWQAVVDGRPDGVRALYPGAAIDHYPFEAPSLEEGSPEQREMAERYAPAVAAGNQMATMGQRSVQDLVAEGPGTLSPAAAQRSRGAGAYNQAGWTVMLVRPAPAAMAAGQRTQVAFAVWNGALDEVGARKMRSVWSDRHGERITMKTERDSRSAADLLAAAAEWRVLSLLLARPTAERKREALRVSRELGGEELQRAVRHWTAAASEGAYLQLLGPGGLVASRAVAYRPFSDPGWLLADIGRHYAAFGFCSGAEDPPDHVAVLADFVGYMFLKEAYARECEDRTLVELTCQARRRFIEEFVVPMAAPIAERLDACGAGEWAVAARIIAGQIPAPTPSVMPPTSDPMACDGCAME